MTDLTRIEESINHLWTIGEDCSAQRMQALLDVARAANRHVECDQNNMPDSDLYWDRLIEALAKLEEVK